ncbi:hypothetical protein NVP1063O_196 [Vibrio phage 1.063.O._10N.261.45.C7]|nr:hypothetical protein NVP1063O_196 [Vibrio phage 1.063.O._10N.261.45.C7]
MNITKEQAESIYSIWCSSEDSKFEYKDWIYGLEYDDEGDVVFTDGDDDWVKLTLLDADEVKVSIYEWVETEVKGWKI